MLGDILSQELLVMVLPVIVLQLGLAIYCIVRILREGVENLNKPAWILISLLLNLIGPVIFLIVGRKKQR